MSTFGYTIEEHVAKAIHDSSEITTWDDLPDSDKVIWRGNAKASLDAMKKYQFLMDRSHNVHIPHHQVPSLIKFLHNPNGEHSPVRDVSFQAGSGVWVVTFPWSAHDAHNDSFRHPLPPIPEEPKLEWAVEYVTAGTTPHIGYNQFLDQASCERFIQSPPLWFDTSWQSVTGVVTRQAAGSWERIPENKNLES